MSELEAQIVQSKIKIMNAFNFASQKSATLLDELN